MSVDPSTTAPSMAFSSSRTFPGQGIALQYARAVCAMPVIFRPHSCAYFFGESSAAATCLPAVRAVGRSQRHHVAGKNKILTNVPFFTASSRLRFVAASTRMFSLIVCCRPRVPSRACCRTRSSLACSSGDTLQSHPEKPCRLFGHLQLACSLRNAPVKAPFSWPNSSLRAAYPSEPRS